MPRKTKLETTTATKLAKTKTVKEKKAATNAKKTVGNKASKTKPKSAESIITETPKHSEIILEYSRFGNLGLAHVHEAVDISFLTKKKFTGKITTLFHFIRQTEVCKNLDSGRTAIFQIDGRPVIGIVQKAGDYENQAFTLTKYKPDGTRQSTRRYSYVKTKNLILQAFGFETKIDESEDAEKSETSNENSESKGNMEITSDIGNFDDDIDSEFDGIGEV